MRMPVHVRMNHIVVPSHDFSGEPRPDLSELAKVQQTGGPVDSDTIQIGIGIEPPGVSCLVAGVDIDGVTSLQKLLREFEDVFFDPSFNRRKEGSDLGDLQTGGPAAGLTRCWDS